MPITRRRMLGWIGVALAAPAVIRTDRAEAAATMKRLGNVFLLGAGQPGGKFKVGLAAFPNIDRGFIASWLNYRGGTDFRAFVQYFGAGGSPLSLPIQMGGPAGPTDGVPAVSVFPIANPDGTSLILFSAARNGQSAADAVDLFGQRMSATRQKTGNPYLVSTKTSFDQTTAFGTRLSNGNFMAAWQNTGTTVDAYDVRERIFAFSGTGVSPERRAHPEIAGLQTPRSVTALAGGRSVVSYSSQVNGLWRLRATVVAADGTPTAPSATFKSVDADDQFGSAGVTALGASKWTAAWYAKRSDVTARLTTQTFDGTTPTKPPLGLFDLRCGEDFADTPTVVAVDPAPADRVLLNYLAQNSTGASTVQGRIVNTNTGALVTAPLPIRTSPSGLHPTNEGLVRQSSKFFVAGFSEGNGNPQTSKAGIQRLEFNPGP